MSADLSQFCGVCNETVACYEDEPGTCPFCGNAVTDMGDYIDQVQDAAED